jgi:hypothetical protein
VGLMGLAAPTSARVTAGQNDRSRQSGAGCAAALRQEGPFVAGLMLPAPNIDPPKRTVRRHREDCRVEAAPPPRLASPRSAGALQPRSLSDSSARSRARTSGLQNFSLGERPDPRASNWSPVGPGKHSAARAIGGSWYTASVFFATGPREWWMPEPSPSPHRSGFEEHRSFASDITSQLQNETAHLATSGSQDVETSAQRP